VVAAIRGVLDEDLFERSRRSTKSLAPGDVRVEVRRFDVPSRHPLAQRLAVAAGRAELEAAQRLSVAERGCYGLTGLLL